MPVAQGQALRVWSCAGLSPEHGRVAGGEFGERGGSDAAPFVRVETHGRFGSFAPFNGSLYRWVGWTRSADRARVRLTRTESGRRANDCRLYREL
jgi:hypothetical protein